MAAYRQPSSKTGSTHSAISLYVLQTQGYPGGYGRVVEFVRHWREEAFQFDWSCEYVVFAGLRRRLDVAHIKLVASRAFWLVACPTQSHEMLFDAHAQGFAAFGGIPRRGIYDNMKTAVDRVGEGKERTINARFHAMCGHYLFEPEFYNRAAGWEKGVVEKNVQDRRRQIFHAAAQQHWTSLAVLNSWLADECRAAWLEMRHPQWSEITVADVLESEQPHLMPNPKPFDGYVAQPLRVSTTALIHYQRNRYSVPVEYAHCIVSLRIYPSELVIVSDGQVIAHHMRRFERDQTVYVWQHYIPLVLRKPGALRNGAPFAEMPAPFKTVQRPCCAIPVAIASWRKYSRRCPRMAGRRCRLQWSERWSRVAPAAITYSMSWRG